MSIVLVNSPCSDKNLLGDTWFMPLGLMNIASYLEDFGINVKLVDGIVEGLDRTLERCSSDIVGVNFNCMSIPGMESIVRKAKSEGAFTVLGGQAASAMPTLLLENNKNVDAVVVGDGEEAMLQLSKALSNGGDLSSVPNLVYREAKKIITNPCYETPISRLPMPQRYAGGLDPEMYINNYSVSCSDPFKANLRTTNVVTRRGCPRRAAGKGCSFCARMDRKVRSRTPLQAWQEYKYLVNELGVEYLYDDSDSWINTGWLSELADIWESNGGLNVRLRVYGDIRDITAESTTLMRRLNVDTVLVGIESGDRNVLMQNGKDFTNNDIKEACKNLANADIKIADAYVLGLIGESWESLENTKILSETINLICEKAATYWNIMLPLPGSPSWQVLMEKSPIAREHSTNYKIDVDLIREEFFKACTGLGANAFNRLKVFRDDMCLKSLMPAGENLR